MGRYLLGLDNGNTVCKAALLTVDGHEVQTASGRIDTLHPQPGWVERDMAQVWAVTAQVIREAVRGVDPAQIVAVGCTGHGNGLYLLDKAGQPLRNGIQSLDQRAAALVDAWLAQGLHTQVHPRILQSFYPAQAAPLLAWLRQHDRGAYDRIGSVLMSKDYINYCLTAETATDYTDIGTTALLDTRHKRYAPDLLEHYGIPEVYDALPRLAHSTELIGSVTADAAALTGLHAGTPVIAGMIDIDACAVGAGVTQPGQACIVVGTWSINEVVTSELVIAPDLFLTAPFADPDLWLAVEASATSAANLEWFVNQFCAEERLAAQQRGISVYEVCSEVVAAVPVTDAVPVFHPFLYGSNVQGSAHAGFYGMAGWHTRAHLLRALYEGVVYGHLDHINRLKEAGVVFDSARLTGGGSRSAVWAQMFADVLGVCIEVPARAETGAHGAALAAGVGAGVYASLQEAATQGVHIQQVYNPDAQNRAQYEARYAVYVALIEALRHPWQHMTRHLTSKA